MKKKYERGCGVDALVQGETLLHLCLFRVSTVDAEFRLRSEILRHVQGFGLYIGAGEGGTEYGNL